MNYFLWGSAIVVHVSFHSSWVVVAWERAVWIKVAQINDNLTATERRTDSLRYLLWYGPEFANQNREE